MSLNKHAPAKSKPKDPARVTNSRPISLKDLVEIEEAAESAAELWLDFFQDIVSGTIDCTMNRQELEQRILQAADLADAAIHQYESRWPGVRL